MKKLLSVLIVITIALCFSNLTIAAEHPGQEHPGKEHPGKEHPGEAISAEAIRGAIESYAKNESELKGGYFLFYDASEKKLLQLSLVRVHDRVSLIKKENAYFACADFKAIDGTAYDLDFWMKKDRHGELEVYKIKVHKKDGTSRFTYRDDEISPVNGKKAPEKGT